MSDSKLTPGIRIHRNKYQVRYRGTDGRERARSFAKITEARKFRAAMMTDKERGEWRDPKDSRVPFADVTEAHLSRKLKLRPRTAEKYRSSLRCYLEPAFGLTPIGAITSDHIQDWVSGMVRQGLAPETVRGHYRLMASIMKRAAEVGRIPASPCRGVDLPAVERVEQRFLNESEVERLAAGTPERYRTLVYVAAYLGLRWQEVSGLRRDVISMRPNRLATVRVVTTIERSNGHCQAVEYGKSAAARRTLKMPEFLREMLAWHLGAFPSDEWVFTAPGGGFLRYDNFRARVWAPAVKAAWLDGLTFHQLRHTAATFMIDDGADPLQIKRRMGHEDIATTYNLYGHLFEDREEELVAGLDRRKLNADQGRTSDGDVIGLRVEKAR